MRLFFALWLPSDAAARLAGIARANAGQFGGRPTRQEAIHLTLAFLGEVPEENLPLPVRTAQLVHSTPFALDIDRLGHWARQRVLWAGPASPCPALDALVGNLRRALVDAGFAVDDWNRGFTAHITLIRKLPGVPTSLALPAIEPINSLCSSFALVHSQTSDAGSNYRTVADFPLSRR